MSRTPQYPPDTGLISPDQIAEFNRRYDAERRKLPQYFVSVPPGFDKRLKDAELDLLVWDHIRKVDAERNLLAMLTTSVSIYA